MSILKTEGPVEVKAFYKTIIEGDVEYLSIDTDKFEKLIKDSNPHLEFTHFEENPEEILNGELSVYDRLGLKEALIDDNVVSGKYTDVDAEYDVVNYFK